MSKIVIITDGYLEAEDRAADTKLTPQLYKSLIIGNTNEMISMLGLNIPKVNVDLSNTEILICEVNERKTGKGKDREAPDFIVLEVNSAPSMGEITLEKYREELPKIAARKFAKNK